MGKKRYDRGEKRDGGSDKRFNGVQKGSRQTVYQILTKQGRIHGRFSRVLLGRGSSIAEVALTCHTPSHTPMTPEHPK